MQDETIAFMLEDVVLVAVPQTVRRAVNGLVDKVLVSVAKKDEDEGYAAGVSAITSAINQQRNAQPDLADNYASLRKHLLNHLPDYLSFVQEFQDAIRFRGPNLPAAAYLVGIPLAGVGIEGIASSHAYLHGFIVGLVVGAWLYVAQLAAHADHTSKFAKGKETLHQEALKAFALPFHQG